MLNLVTPPQSLCILRLSALGDTCHVVPLVRALQRHWPDTQLTWVIGELEARLMRLLPHVEFITVNKRAGWGSLGPLRAGIGRRRFDVLLHLQLSLRASLLSTCIPARLRLGFDRARARELQWLFTNAQVPAHTNQHVLDGFLDFLAAVGINDRTLRWDLPVPAEAQAYAQALIPDDQPTLVVSPCSSHPLRNWSPARHAEVIRYAVHRHGMRVILCGGGTELERATGAQIEQLAACALINQIGRDTLPQLLALLARAKVLIAPDSGPAHMATMVGTPVIGLYAATRLKRSGPYLSARWCVDRYDVAARRYRNCGAAQLPWQEKIEEPGVMDLIEVGDVKARLDELSRGWTATIGP